MPVAIESACTATCKVELATCTQGSIYKLQFTSKHVLIVLTAYHARLSLSALYSAVSGFLSTWYTDGMAEASDLVILSGTDSSLSSESETDSDYDISEVEATGPSIQVF